MQSREEYYDLSDDDREVEGDVLVLDPRQEKHVPGFDFGKMVGRGDDYVDSDHEAEEIVIMPKPDYVKKRQGAGGAIAFDKQLGRPLDIDLDEDEPMIAVGISDPIPNDPSRPRVRGIDLDKKPARFKFEPKDDDAVNEEVIIPAEVKPIDREKVLFNMSKAQDRWPKEKKRREPTNKDLDDL